MVTYVDDCLLVGPSIQDIQALKEKIASAYEIDDRGYAAYFLGIEILRNRPSRRLWLTQRRYISEAIQHFGLVEAKPAIIPLQPSLLGNTPASTDLLKAEIKLFQSIVGTVMYAMLLTRPDVAFAV